MRPSATMIDHISTKPGSARSGLQAQCMLVGKETIPGTSNLPADAQLMCLDIIPSSVGHCHPKAARSALTHCSTGIIIVMAEIGPRDQRSCLMIRRGTVSLHFYWLISRFCTSATNSAVDICSEIILFAFANVWRTL